MLDEIFTHAEEVAWQIDTKLQLTYVSPNVENVFGYSVEDCLGAELTQFLCLHSAKRAKQVFSKLSQESRVKRRYLVSLLRKNQKQVIVDTSLMGIYDKEQNLKSFAGITRPVGRYLRKRQNLLNSRHLLRKDLESRERFFSVVSHEMRNHLNVINGLSYFLLENQHEVALEEEQDALASLHFSAEHLTVLVNDILDLERIRKNTLKLQNRVFGLRDLLRKLRQIFHLQAQDKQIKFRLLEDAELPEKVQGDATRLNQILSNLLSNAIKFTKAGVVELIVSKANPPENKSEISNKTWILFEVKDSGIGMTSEELLHILSPFTQANNEIQENFGGSGLGLFVVQNLVNLYQGQLHIKSKFKQGSSFEVLLPFDNISAETLNLSMTTILTEDEPIIDWQDFNVLYVEDVRFNQFLAKKLFERWQISLDVADNAEMAQQKLQNRQYQLILMDIRMPGMDGYELSKLIREEYKLKHQHVPIVALSGSDLSISRGKVKSAGMDNVLRKPFHPDELHEMLKSYARNQGKTPRRLPPTPKVTYNVEFDFFEELFGSTPEELLKVLTSAQQDLLHFAEKMKEAILAQNKETVSDIRHRIKPLLLNFGQKKAVKYLGSIDDLSEKTEQELRLTSALCHRYLSSFAKEIQIYIDDHIKI